MRFWFWAAVLLIVAIGAVVAITVQPWATRTPFPIFRPASSQDWQVVQNDVYSFRISVPSHWRVDAHDDVIIIDLTHSLADDLLKTNRLVISMRPQISPELATTLTTQIHQHNGMTVAGLRVASSVNINNETTYSESLRFMRGTTLFTITKEAILSGNLAHVPPSWDPVASARMFDPAISTFTFFGS
jgi:hypothetical protein